MNPRKDKITMRMNGLSRKQYFRESIFKLPTQSIFIKLSILSLLSVCGCNHWQSTVFEYYNFSNYRIYVTVLGTEQDASPGVLVPNDPGETTPVASSIFDETVRFENKVKIIWTIGEEETKHEKEFSRDGLGIPAVVSGGKITFTYTKDGVWEIKYSK